MPGDRVDRRNAYPGTGPSPGVDAVEVTTDVYLPPDEVFDFLVDFPRYSHYSEYLEDVRQRGDGGPGTEYELVFSWWKLRYTARSEVTEVDPPNRVDWRVTKDVAAEGHWRLEPVDPPEGREHATSVTLAIEYDPDTADPDLSLPPFLSLSRLVERVKPKVEQEARRVVGRIVEDLEGEPRDVDVEIRRG